MDYYKKKKLSILKRELDYMIKVSRPYSTFSKFLEDISIVTIDKFIDKKGMITWGKLDYTTNTITIALGVHKNTGQVLDTLAHELAHVGFRGHGREHTRLKSCLKRLVKVYIYYHELDLSMASKEVDYE